LRKSQLFIIQKSIRTGEWTVGKGRLKLKSETHKKGTPSFIQKKRPVSLLSHSFGKVGISRKKKNTLRGTESQILQRGGEASPPIKFGKLGLRVFGFKKAPGIRGLPRKRGWYLRRMNQKGRES